MGAGDTGVPGDGIHRPAAWNRRAGRGGGRETVAGPIQQSPFSVLREETGPAERTFVGGGRVSAVVQAAGQRQLPMAAERNGSAAADSTGSPMASGRAGHRAAESHQTWEKGVALLKNRKKFEKSGRISMMVLVK